SLWSKGDEVSLFGAWGPCERGGEALTRTFGWVGSRFGGGELRSEYVTVRAVGDLAYTVGYERGTEMVVDGGPPQSMTIRVTQIYRRDPDGWKLVHRHGDFAPLSPSTTAPESEGREPQNTMHMRSPRSQTRIS